MNSTYFWNKLSFIYFDSRLYRQMVALITKNPYFSEWGVFNGRYILQEKLETKGTENT